MEHLLFCVNHPEKIAKRHCNKCDKNLCDECVFDTHKASWRNIKT